MLNGPTESQRRTLRAFWQCLGATLTLTGLAALAEMRPDLLSTSFGALAVLALILTLIGLPDAWRIWRGRDF